MQVILICGLFTVMAPHTSEQWISVTGGKGNYKGRKADVVGQDIGWQAGSACPAWQRAPKRPRRLT